MECAICYYGFVSPHSNEDVCERCMILCIENVVCIEGDY